MIPPPMDVSEDVSPAVVERVTHIELGGYTFNADFDSGNLARIEQRSEAEAAKRWKDHQLSSSPQPDFRSPSSAGTWRSIANAATQRTARPPPLFTLWTRADCEGTPHATKSRSWFHFSVRGAPVNRVLQFEIIMSNQAKLFSHDMRPVYRSLPSQPEWRPVKSATPWKVTYPDEEPEYDGFGTPPPLKSLVASARWRDRERKTNRGGGIFSIYLTHKVEVPGETLYFAFCYPHSYADTMARLAITDALFQQPTSHVAPHVAPMLLPRPPAWLRAIFDWLPTWLGGGGVLFDTSSSPHPSSRSRSPLPSAQSPALARPSSRVHLVPPTSPFPGAASSGGGGGSGSERHPTFRHRPESDAERETERTALARFNRTRLHSVAHKAVLTASKAAREQSLVWSSELVGSSAGGTCLGGGGGGGGGGGVGGGGSSPHAGSGWAAAASSRGDTSMGAIGAMGGVGVSSVSSRSQLTITSVKLAAEHERTNQELATAAATSAAALLPTSTPKGVYYKRELLARSLEGRRIDLITITSVGGKAADGSCEERLPPPLMPEGGARPERFPSKRYVLITSRVHPGETPASHVFDGLLAFLLREDDPRAVALRERFVFKLIPLLNPDGVYHGHYRSDTRGANLNRKYASATYEAHPSIFASMALARQLHTSTDLMAVIDLHAHAGKRGCFFYGNRQPSQPAQAEAALFMTLVGLNTRWLTLNGCTFFGAGSHDGSSRAAMYRLTGLPLVFTLECNYNRGNSPNELPRRHIADGVDAGSLTPDGPSSREISPKYDPTCWGDIGKAIAIAVLDMSGANPCSRLGPPNRRADDLRRMRASVQIWAARMQAQPNVCCPSDDDEAAEDGIDAALVCDEADDPESPPRPTGGDGGGGGSGGGGVSNVPASRQGGAASQWPGSPLPQASSPLRQASSPTNGRTSTASSAASSAASTRSPSKLKLGGPLSPGTPSAAGKKFALPPRPSLTGATGGLGKKGAAAQPPAVAQVV